MRIGKVLLFYSGSKVMVVFGVWLSILRLFTWGLFGSREKDSGMFNRFYRDFYEMF